MKRSQAAWISSSCPPAPSEGSVKKKKFCHPLPSPPKDKPQVKMLSAALCLEPLLIGDFTLPERRDQRGHLWISQLLGYLRVRSLMSLSLSFPFRKMGIIIPFSKALQRPSKKRICTRLENTKHWDKFFGIHYYFSSFSPVDEVDAIAIFQMGKWRH